MIPLVTQEEYRPATVLRCQCSEQQASSSTDVSGKSFPQIRRRAQEGNFAKLLRSCTTARDLSGGKRVHVRIWQTEHRSSTYLANLLMDMYAKCGSVSTARSVFDQIREPNLYSWNIMVCGYAMNGFVECALNLYYRMPHRTVIACTAIIEALGFVEAVERAKDLFDRFPQERKDVTCENAMLAVYARNGHLQESEEMLRRIQSANVVSWSTVMIAYADHEDVEGAFRIFLEMPRRNEIVWFSLIAAFAQQGHFGGAKALFRKMPCHNPTSWSTVMLLHSQEGRLSKAEAMFRRMPWKNMEAWATMFGAYLEEEGYLESARDVLDRMPQHSDQLWRAIISAYLEHKQIVRAKRSFDALPDADVDGWNALVTQGADEP